MAFNKTDRDGAPMRRRGGMHRRKKVCVFCGKDNTIDSSKKNHRKLCKTSESFDSCYQESTSYRNYALRSGLILNRQVHNVYKRTIRKNRPFCTLQESNFL